MSTFCSRSARSEGRSICAGSHASVRLTGPSASSSTQQQRRPNSSQVPSTSSPPGAKPARSVAQAAGTSAASASGESLLVLIDRTAREAGLGNSLRDQSPDQNKALRLRLEGVQFDAMVAWLASLQSQYGVSIEAAAVDGTGPGIVNASLTLSRPAG